MVLVVLIGWGVGEIKRDRDIGFPISLFIWGGLNKQKGGHIPVINKLFTFWDMARNVIGFLPD